MDLSRCCVISLAFNAEPPSGFPVVYKNYSVGLMRISETLRENGFPGAILLWDQKYPPGAPSHTESPWGFKPFCFSEAERQGYRYVLWLDASIRIKRPLDGLFELIAQRGHCFFSERHSVGEYCKDAALVTLGITREQALATPSCWACALGLDLADKRAKAFLADWIGYAKDGVTFPGAKWSGCRGWPPSASADGRVKGHRGEQGAASVVALRYGMSEWQSREYFELYFENGRKFIPVVATKTRP